MAGVSRPVSFSPGELGFTPSPPVAWLEPSNMAEMARIRLSGQPAPDNREAQGAQPVEGYEHSYGPELWFDYVAGTGDGFDATYTVAYLLAAPVLKVGGAELPRGELLVMGGDLVQPAASWWNYQDRLVGPYAAARPSVDDDESTPLYALPGATDRADGMAAFRHVFAEEASIGAWRVAQHRSYFALKLPHHWWLFALDIPPGGIVDRTQLRYFAGIARYLAPGDRVILAVAEPTWVTGATVPAAHDGVDLFIRKVVDPTGAQVRVMLAGEEHHYVRYSGPAEAITCGGGGAFTTTTHHLPDEITIPPADSPNLAGGVPRTHRLVAAYPDRGRSVTLPWSLFHRLPRNLGYLALLAVLQAALMLTVVKVAESPTVTVLVLIATAVAAVLIPGQTGSLSDLLQRATSFGIPVAASSGRHRALLAVHILAQIGLGLVCAHVWAGLPPAKASGWWPLVWAFVVYAPVLGLAAGVVSAAYLQLSARFVPANRMVLEAVLGSDAHKSFLRLHIAADGSLTIHPIGLAAPAHRWVTAPEAAPGEPWVRPFHPLVVRLIEPPVRIG